MRTRRFRIIAAATAAAISLSVMDLRPVVAATVAPSKTTEAKQATSTMEFSARKRRHHRYRRHHGAGFGAVLGLFGAIAGFAAAERARRDGYYYGYPYGPYPYHPYYGPYGAPYYDDLY